MGKYEFVTEIKTRKVEGKARKVAALPNKEFNKFTPLVLGLGGINQPSIAVESIAAVFDLSGFTKFCSRADTHLTVPKYLSSFLDWLFEDLRNTHVQMSLKTNKVLYSELPFLAKFTGDGVLFLWDTARMLESEVAICNIPMILHSICEDYVKEFYPKISKGNVDTPKTLRCGIARGRVCSVGNGDDYVGPCINIAFRLQNLSSLAFCCHYKGFDLEKHANAYLRPKLVRKRVTLRGIGKDELVWVFRDDFKNLPPEEKQQFRKP